MKSVWGESKFLTPCHRPGFLLLGLALQCTLLFTDGIKLANVTVPPVGIIGQSITLECTFILESDTLYSLKWYKDGHEFFRYHPTMRPNSIQTFDVGGIKLDNRTLSPSKITLRNLGLDSSGTYRCEISSESPLFQTRVEEKNLTVIIPPNPLNPRLSQFPRTIYMNRMINGTCTSYKSFPPANLTFFLNDVKLTGSNVTVYEPVSEFGERQQQKLFTSVLGLRLKVGSNHFLRGAIRIKCVASILGQEWETQRNITHQNYHPPQSSYSSGSVGLSMPTFWSCSTFWTTFFSALNLCTISVVASCVFSHLNCFSFTNNL